MEKLLNQSKCMFIFMLVGFLLFSCKEDTEITSIEQNEQSPNFVDAEEATKIASIIAYPVSEN